MKTNLTGIEALALAKAAAAVEDAASMADGTTETFDLVLHIKGSMTKGKPSVKKPTSRALTLETLALMFHRLGVQREAAAEVIVAALTDSITLDADAKKTLLETTGVAAAKVKIDEIMDTLPKTPVAGRVTTVVELVESLSLDDAGSVKATG